MRILHVDDEPVILELTQFYLERTGDMKITSCRSAEEALGLLEIEKFDAIISDYEMPGMNGIDLLSRLRSANITIPFVIFTGRGREEVVIEALNKGADFYIQKGGEVRSQFAELRNAIRRAVEKHRFEQDIRESERRISDIFCHLPDATFAVDCSGRVIAWNRAMESMTGIAADDISGTGDHAYALPFYGAPRPLLVDYLLHPGKKVPPSYLLNQRDRDLIIAETAEASLNGERVVLWVKATSLYDKNGTVAGAIESIRDITTQKQTEKALRSAGEYRRTLIEAHIDPLVTIGSDRRISDVNAATEALTGRTRDALIGTEFCTLFTEPGCAESAYREVVADGTIREQALTVRRSDGGIQPVLLYGTVYRGEDGEARGVFAELHEPMPGPESGGICRRMSPSVAELVPRIISASTAAASAEEFLESALDVVRDLLEIEESCLALYDGDGAFNIVERKDPGPFGEILSSFRDFAGSHTMPVTEGRRDGAGNPVLLVPVADPERVLGILCLSVRKPDSPTYGERAALEVSAELIGALLSRMLRVEAAEEARRSAALHLDIIAHDLTNAIFAARGYADILDGMLEGEAGKIAGKTTLAIRKSYDVIRNLDTLKKIRKTRRDTAPLRAVSLDTVLQHEISNFPGIRIDYAGCESVILADELIGEVFWNLLDNSVKHGGREVSIRIGVREEKDRVEVRVEDTGPGIPEEMRRMLSSEVHGHGLCIVRDLVASYGGEIQIEERIPGRSGKGVAVRIVFGRAKAGISSPPAGSSEEETGVPDIRA
ncbi:MULTISPECIES: PAS domain S-box protein [Methanomicrobiaceae]|jgi:PAS domain S-box-containing protein|uniref:PAS domain S-box protein n=3 Tax=Methanomicrobiaceae TaxID=2194 RepID=UPI00316ABE24